MNYYNEFEPKAAAWLRELIAARLIPGGDVDERSICDVQPEDVRGYTSCHWFCGVGGWPYALRIAGWPDNKPVWTGSAPCQPFSVAGKGEGIDDERHLWPEMFRLIEACHPEVIFGEQVASSEVVGSQLEAAFVDAVQKGDFATVNRIANCLVKSPAFGSDRRWLDGIQDDLESLNYAVGSPVLAASSVGAPHKRQRLYWVAYHEGQGRPGMESERQSRIVERARVGSDCATDGLADPQCDAGRPDEPGWGQEGREADGRDCADAHTLADGTSGGQRIDGSAPRQCGHADECGEVVALGDSIQLGLEGHAGNGDDRDQPGRGDAREVGPVAAAGGAMPVVQPDSTGRQPGQSATTTTGHGGAVEPAGFWSDYRIIQTRDGKFRRIPNAESMVFGVVDGVSSHLDAMRDLGLSENEIEEITQAMSGFPLAGKIPGRVMLLKGFGNAIVPELAAEFIKAYLAVMSP